MYAIRSYYGKELAVLTGHYIFRDQRFAETRPAGTRFILILGAEQRFAGDNINIDTLLVIVPVFILKGRLGAFLLGYFILQRRKPLFKFMFTPLFAVFAPDLVEISVAPGTRAVKFITQRVILIIVLVIFFGRVKCLGRLDRRNYA